MAYTTCILQMLLPTFLQQLNRILTETQHGDFHSPFFINYELLVLIFVLTFSSPKILHPRI